MEILFERLERAIAAAIAKINELRRHFDRLAARLGGAEWPPCDPGPTRHRDPKGEIRRRYWAALRSRGPLNTEIVAWRMYRARWDPVPQRGREGGTTREKE